MIDVDVTLPASLTPTVTQAEATASIGWTTSNSRVRIIGADLAALQACVDAMQAAITAAHQPADAGDDLWARIARARGLIALGSSAGPAELIPVRAVLCDDQARLETADGKAVAVITATIVAGQPIYAGDSLITQQLPVSGGWYWVGWPSASQIDAGPGVDLGDGFYLVTVVDGEGGE